MKTEGKRNLLRQPDEIRLMTGGAQTEQETAPDAAAFRAGDVTVELAEADGSLAVFVQAQNTPVRELVLTWKAMFGGAGEVLGDTWERGYGDLEWKKEADHIGMPWYFFRHEAGKCLAFGVKVRPSAMCWWEKDGVGVATFYTQADDGAYFLYNMPCSKEDYDSMLVEGAKIRVSGYKAEWSGEVEIIDATCELLEGTKVYDALDVTSLLGTDELIAHQNEKVSFKGMTVAASNDAGAPFLYNWDGSGSEGDDLYFNVSLNDKIYTFVVESYLCGPGTDVYEAVKALNVGDVVDMEGFLYWYEGVNPHITSVVKAAA